MCIVSSACGRPDASLIAALLPLTSAGCLCVVPRQKCVTDKASAGLCACFVCGDLFLARAGREGRIINVRGIDANRLFLVTGTAFSLGVLWDSEAYRFS